MLAEQDLDTSKPSYLLDQGSQEVSSGTAERAICSVHGSSYAPTAHAVLSKSIHEPWTHIPTLATKRHEALFSAANCVTAES
jgi:hypothetical protein